MSKSLRKVELVAYHAAWSDVARLKQNVKLNLFAIIIQAVRE